MCLVDAAPRLKGAYANATPATNLSYADAETAPVTSRVGQGCEGKDGLGLPGRYSLVPTVQGHQCGL